MQWCKDRLAEVCIGLQQMQSASSDSEGAGSRQTHRVEELGQALEALTGQVLTLKNHLREWDGRVRTLDSNVQWVKDQLEARLASFASDLGVLHAALPAQQPQPAEPPDSWMQKWEAFQLTLLEKIQKDQRDLHKALQRHLGETEARRQTEWAQEKAALLAEVQTMLLSAFPAQMPSVLSDPSQASSSVQAAPPPSRHQTQHPAPALAPVQHSSPASPAASKVELLEEQVRELEAQLSLAHAAAAAGASTVNSEEDPQEIERGSHIQSRFQAPRSTTQPAKGRLVPPSSRASSHRGGNPQIPHS